MRVRLSSKFVVITCSTFLVIMLIFAFVHVKALKNNFLEEAIYEADSLSEMMLRNTYYLMLDDDRATLQKIIDEAGGMARIEKVRLFGREGIVKFSTEKSEIGTALTDKDEGCIFCHVSDSAVLLDAPAERRSRVYTDAAGKQVLSMARGIYNEPNCFTAACHFHSEQETKLGILEVVLSLDKMTAQASVYSTDIFVLTFLILLVISLVQFLFTKKLVSTPLNDLLYHVKCLGGGNLSARIETNSGDEIGDLGEEFNQMADSLADAQGELCDLAINLELKVEERTARIKEMQTQLIQSAKLASMGELVAGIAHEINNPLGGILMFASLVAKMPDLPPQARENLQVILNETQRCAKIVRGLLEFSRESIPEKRPDSVHRVIKQSLELVTQQSLFQNVTVQCDYCADVPLMNIDPDQLQQVFFNLFINAAQAMPRGGTLQIKTSLLAAENVLLIEVKDSGYGISAEHLERIFDPFFSTKAQNGFGLGLSISYGIIQNHHGKIEVESELGEGTCFRIRLPLDEEATLPATEDSWQSAAPGT